MPPRLGQSSLVTSLSTSSLASNQNTSLHDVTILTVTETKDIKSIKEKHIAFTFRQWKYVTNSNTVKLLTWHNYGFPKTSYFSWFIHVLKY